MQAALDWSLIPAFLATARTGSLSGAARELGLSQPTVGRYIADLEASLGVRLFERSTRRVQITAAGREAFDAFWPVMFQHYEQMFRGIGEDVDAAGKICKAILKPLLKRMADDDEP